MTPGDGYRRWLYVLATASYAAGSGLPALELDDEVADVRAAFELMGYPAAGHTLASAADEHSAVTALREWLAAKGASDVVAIYVTGHGQALTINETTTLCLHTSQSRKDSPAGTIAPSQLIKGLQKIDSTDQVRNLLLVLDVCGAGAGLMESLRAVRGTLQNWHEEPGTSLGAHLVATARTEDDARSRLFSAAFLRAVSDPGVAPRNRPYLDLASVLSTVQRDLLRQVVDPASLGASGENLCLPNPRHHLLGVDPGEMADWWEPRARGVPQSTRPRSRADTDAVRWLFTGRRRVNRRIADWLADPRATGVLVLTAGPGSGKSSVLARMIALTVPDFRRELAGAGVELAPAECPPAGFTFAATIWANGLDAAQITGRLCTALGLDPGEDLATLTARAIPAVAPVVAIDAADEADEPVRLAMEVLRPLAAATRQGVIRLLVATRRPPSSSDPATGRTSETDLIAALTTESDTILDLDSPDWLEFGDIAAYAELLLSEPVNHRNRANPYATRPQECRALARAIETLSRHSFLLAASVARRHTLDDAVVDPTSAGWRAQFPKTIGDALRQEFEGYGTSAAARWMVILRPLAFAQGIGVCRDVISGRDLWAEMATTLDPSTQQITAADIDTFLGERVATHLVSRIDASGVTFYQFHHGSLAEQFLETEDVAAQHGRIVDLLTDALGADPRGWHGAGRYVRRALPGHARHAGRIAELLADARFVVHCDPDRVYAALRATADGVARDVRLLLRPMLHRLPAMPPGQRAFVLSVSALASDVTRPIAKALARLAVPGVRIGPAAVRPSTDHLVLTEAPTVVRRVAAATDRNGWPVVFTTSTNDVEVWDPDEGSLLERLASSPRYLMSLLAFTDRDGYPVLAASGSSGEVAVWDVTTRFLITRSPPDQPVGHSLCAGLLAPDRPFLAGWRPHGVALWEPGHDDVTTIPVGAFPVTSVTTIARPGAADLVAVAAGDRIELWDPRTARSAGSFPAPDPRNVQLAGLGRHRTDGALLITAGLPDGGVWMFQMHDSSGAQLAAGEAPTCAAAVTDAAGWTVLALGYPSGAIHLTGAEPGDPGRILRAEGPTINAVGIGHAGDGTMIVAGGDQVGRVQAWRGGGGEPLLSAVGGGRVDDLALGMFRDGAPFAVTGSISSVRIWDLHHHMLVDDLALHAGEPYCIVGFIEQGRRHLATAGSDSTLRIWDTKTAASTVRASVPPDQTARLISWRDHGVMRLALSTYDGLFLLDAHGTEPYRHVELGATSAITLLPTAARHSPLLAVAVGQDVHLVDSATGRTEHVLTVPAPPGGVDRNPLSRTATSLAAGRLVSGKVFLAVGTEDGIVWVWPQAGDQFGDPTPLPGHQGPVLSLLAGRIPTSFLAVGSRHGSARIWDPGNGMLISDCGNESPLGGTWNTLSDRFVRWATLPKELLATISDADGHSDLHVRDTTGRQLWHHRDNRPNGTGAHCSGTSPDGQPFLAVARDGGIDLARPLTAQDVTHLPLPAPVQDMCAVGSTIYAASGGGFVAINVLDRAGPVR